MLTVEYAGLLCAIWNGQWFQTSVWSTVNTEHGSRKHLNDCRHKKKERKCNKKKQYRGISPFSFVGLADERGWGCHQLRKWICPARTGTVSPRGPGDRLLSSSQVDPDVHRGLHILLMQHVDNAFLKKKDLTRFSHVAPEDECVSTGPSQPETVDFFSKKKKLKKNPAQFWMS